MVWNLAASQMHTQPRTSLCLAGLGLQEITQLLGHEAMIWQMASGYTWSGQLKVLLAILQLAEDKWSGDRCLLLSTALAAPPHTSPSDTGSGMCRLPGNRAVQRQALERHQWWL